MNTLQINTPKSLTKQLKLNTVNGKRKIRLSSNFLPMFGFNPGQRISSEVRSDNVIRVGFDSAGSQKVYERTYKHRKNNPTEALLEISKQSILSAIPSYTNRIHIEMKAGEVLIRPLENLAFSARSYLRRLENPLEAFFALSSGIDMHSAQKHGFTFKGLLEYRPNEARDKTDLTETGLLTATANNKIEHVFNEDIYKVDWQRVADLMDVPHVAMLHASLQCDSFSNVQQKKLRETYDFSNTRDMIFPFLEGVKKLKPSVISLEQVANFMDSVEWSLLRLQLERLGYYVQAKNLDAREHGGHTSRVRFYAVASLFPIDESIFPAQQEKRTNPIWDELIAPRLHECRDVSHAKSIQDGAKCGRLRAVNRNKPYSNTPLKSQNRMAKDTLVLEDEGRYYLPSEALLKDLLSIPQDFNTEVVGSTIASEIIGQSIEYGVHEQLMAKIKKHIMDNVGHCRVSDFRQQELQFG